jgi:predicted Zn-dependent protease
MTRLLNVTLLTLTLLAPPGCASRQPLLQDVPQGPTRVIPPDNSYSPAQDVQIGQEAAAQVGKELPMLRDDIVESYVRSLGRRLVAAMPPELEHSEFRYSFDVVNASDINAFALPGGPMFVNRGMLAAAATEGEVAGVLAHELSHVILRHGTAQASRATPYQVGELAGQILGAIVGGQAGSGGPEWLSDHPDPGNRYEYIVQEAQSLRVEKPVRNTGSFESMQRRLRQLPPAPKTPRGA